MTNMTMTAQSTATACPITEALGGNAAAAGAFRSLPQSRSKGLLFAGCLNEIARLNNRIAALEALAPSIDFVTAGREAQLWTPIISEATRLLEEAKAELTAVETRAKDAGWIAPLTEKRSRGTHWVRPAKLRNAVEAVFESLAVNEPDWRRRAQYLEFWTPILDEAQRLTV